MGNDLQQKIAALANRLRESWQAPHVHQLADALVEANRQGDPLPPLLEVLFIDDEWSAIDAVEILAELKDQRAVPALLKALDYNTFQKPFDLYLEDQRQKGADMRGLIAMAEHLGGDIDTLRRLSAQALEQIGTPEALAAAADWQNYGKDAE